jgi:hypothetical protein
VVRRTPGHGAPGARPRLTPNQIEQLQVQAEGGELPTVGDAVRWVARAFGVTSTDTGLRALLKRHAIAL